MIDLKLLRQDPDVVRASQVARGDDPALERAVEELRDRHRELL